MSLKYKKEISNTLHTKCPWKYELCRKELSAPTTQPVSSRIGPPWIDNGNSSLQATALIKKTALFLKMTSGLIALLVYGFNIQFYLTTCNTTTTRTLSSSMRLFWISEILSYTSPLCKSVYTIIIASCSNTVNNSQWLRGSAFFSGNHKTMHHFELQEKLYNCLKWNGKGSHSLYRGTDKNVKKIINWVKQSVFFGVLIFA
jgi:hypothetical protein